jgi:hypothetical protein
VLEGTGRGASALERGTDSAPNSMPGAEGDGLGSRLTGSALVAEGAATLELDNASVALTLTASGACATGAAMVAEITEERRKRKVDGTNIVQRVCGDKKC